MDLAPITVNFGFVEADLGTLCAWYEKREREILAHRSNTVVTRNVAGLLADKLLSLLPLTSIEHRRILLVPTRSPWTAFFDNGWRGTDASGLWYTAQEVRCRAVRVCLADDIKRKKTHVQFGARVFELYGPNRTDWLNHIRSICVMNDGGKWGQSVFGSPLSQEDATWFSAARVRERFQPEHLIELLKRIGIDAFSEDFYASEGAIIERVGPTADGLQEYNLEDVNPYLASTSRGELDRS
jgi:hypothetical protein